MQVAAKSKNKYLNANKNFAQPWPTVRFSELNSQSCDDKCHSQLTHQYRYNTRLANQEDYLILVIQTNLEIFMTVLAILQALKHVRKNQTT